MKTILTGLFAVTLLAAPLLAALGAHAAPTCVDRGGETVRCGRPGAMPVGWSPPPEAMQGRLAGRSEDLGAGKLIGLTLFLGGLFALIALMPDFEGRWDGQGIDEEEQG